MNKNLKNILNFTRHRNNFSDLSDQVISLKNIEGKSVTNLMIKQKHGTSQRRWNWFVNNLEGGMKDQMWKLGRPLIT